LVVYLKEVCRRKTYELVPNIPGIHPIIPEYTPMFFTKNYAGMKDACLYIPLK